MYSESLLIQIEATIRKKIDRLTTEIAELRELTRPISPENSIGRISRMDAINNKSINEAALRQSEQRLTQLEFALGRVHDHDFGSCSQCGQPIQEGRILFRPESVLCMGCAKKR